LYSLSALVVTACSPAIEQIDVSGETMGTTYTLKIIADGVNKSDIMRQVEAVFEQINTQMSTWRPDSEISRFNRIHTSDWFEISDAFMRVLVAAQKINQQTGGAFDITVSGLVNLWGFGPSERRSKAPEPEAIVEILTHTGPSTFEIDLSKNSIRKIDPEAQVDLSGIAKGYAVDAVAEALEQAGANAFLIEVGGEVRASGGRLDGSPWRVAIERPDAQGRSIQTTVVLNNAAIATSGDYRDYFEIGDRRYSHIIDPKTGGPSDNGVASVSVVTTDAMTADALATGLMVMGTEKALALAVKHNIAVMIVERDGNDFVIFSSEAFEALQSSRSN
jgi:thiamine biosynthesis lipoprotein